MRVAFFVNTPGQVHLYKNVIRALIKDGHDIIVLTRNSSSTRFLLDRLNFPYEIYMDGLASRTRKVLTFPLTVMRAYCLLKDRKPDIVVGMGICSATVSKLLHADNIVFNDTERIPFQLPIMRLLSDVVITPSCFTRDLGSRHLRVNSYKELAYLHPDTFVPDEDVRKVLGVARNEDFVLLRFNGLGAVHDLGVEGFTEDEKRKIVTKMSKLIRVFISSETTLPEDLRPYELPVPKTEIHQVINLAKMVIADTGTMITEAAVLGTPGIRYTASLQDDHLGNFIELEKTYGLIYNLDDPQKVLAKAMELIGKSTLDSEWQSRRATMLSEKVNLSSLLIRYIEDYPISVDAALRDGIVAQRQEPAA